MIRISFLLSLCSVLWVNSAVAQIYRPIENNIMWDSYLLRDDDTYQLFYLQNENYPAVDPQRSSSLLASVGRAESTDLVHWTTLPPLNFESYDNDYSLDGHMFIGQAPVKHQGEYYFFFDPRPRSQPGGSPLYALRSPDLGSWSPIPGGPFLQPTPPYYGGSAWRDLFLSYDPTEQIWHGYLCAQTATRPKRETPLDEFTIALWIEMPAAQHNAGAFCINFADPNGQAFESLVLDQERRWSITSEQERKRISATPPPDPAADGEPILLVVVYEKKQVRIYRNQLLYAIYEGTPLTKRPIANITMGRVSALAGAHHPNHFIGSLDDVRIYNRALNATELGQLQPAQGTAVEFPLSPMAAWTFEDTTAADQAGSFVIPEMNFGASVNQGKLSLDGKLAHLYQTAISTPGMSCIAHVTSPDLLQWKYHPPVFSSLRFCNLECPDYFQIGDWHYFTFSTVRTRMDTSGRKDASGTYYIRSRHRDGPYHLAEHPLLFGSGRGRMDNYVGRAILYHGEHLLYYHTVHGNIRDCIARPVTWGAAKRIVQQSDGQLALAYWPGVEKLAAEISYDSSQATNTSQTSGRGNWSQRGAVLTGTPAGNHPSVLWLPPTENDLMITAQVRLEPNATAGFLWRHRDGSGDALLIDPSSHQVLLAKLQYDQNMDALQQDLIDDYNGFNFGTELHVRIMLRSHRVDVYINDQWTHSTSLIGAAPTGRTGLITANGTARFTQLRIRQLKPLETPTLPP